jgi:cell division septum initiation protein DivIVA
MLCTSSESKFVLRLAQKALERFRVSFPRERAFISIKCYPWKTAKQIKSVDSDHLEQVKDDKILIKTYNEGGTELDNKTINESIEFWDKPNEIEYSVLINHSETKSLDVSNKKNRNKLRSIKRPSDITESIQGPQYRTIEFHKETIQDMLPIDSVIEVSDGTQELYNAKLAESQRLSELKKLRDEIDELQDVNNELSLKIKEANEIADTLKKETLMMNVNDECKMQLIKQKDQAILEEEKKVVACEVIIKKMKDITNTLINENKELKSKLNSLKTELEKKQNESFMKSKLLESVDIKLGNGMIELLRIHRTFMDKLQLTDRPISDTLARYMEMQLKLRNAKEKAEKIIKERWPLMFDEWDSYRKEYGLLDSLLFLVQIAN